jgi:hypothetical protein
MDVLLQNSKTTLYVKRDLAWTGHRDEAFVFINSGEAIDFAYANHLSDVHVVLFFRELSYSLIVPFQTELYTKWLPPAGPKERHRFL